MESSISTGFSQLTVKVTSLQAQGVRLQKTAFPCAVPVTPSEGGLLLRLFAVASQSLAHLSLHCLSKMLFGETVVNSHPRVETLRLQSLTS